MGNSVTPDEKVEELFCYEVNREDLYTKSIGVTQSGKSGPDPIAPKPLRGFNYAGAKIDKKDYSTKFVSLFQDRVL